MKMQFKNVS